MRRALACLGPLCWLAGCTLDAGHGFASMVGGELRAELRPSAARDLGDDTLLTDRGYHVQLTRAELHIGAVELLELRGSSGRSAGSGGTFDPANPPAGYTLCHGGHCHAADDSLVSYEEIQAMLAGGSATFAPVVSMPVDRTLDLLRGEDVALDTFEPSAELPEASIARVAVQLERVAIEAIVSHGDLDDLDARVEISAELVLGEALSLVVAETIDRDGPAHIRPMLRVRIDGTVFDGLDFAALAEDGRVVIDEGSAPALLLIEALVTSELEVEL